jgi:hypothetical protein
MRFHVVTTGKGMLPAGRVVGYVEAADPLAAEDALIASDQVPGRFSGHFGFVTAGD